MANTASVETVNGTPLTYSTLIDVFGIKAEKVNNGMNANQWNFLLTPVLEILYFPISDEARRTTYAKYTDTVCNHVISALDHLTPYQRYETNADYPSTIPIITEFQDCMNNMNRLDQLNKKVLSGSHSISDSKLHSIEEFQAWEDKAITLNHLNEVKTYLPRLRGKKDDSQRDYFIVNHKIVIARRQYDRAKSSLISECQKITSIAYSNPEDRKASFENLLKTIKDWKTGMNHMLDYLTTLDTCIKLMNNIRSAFAAFLMDQTKIAHLLPLVKNMPFLPFDKVFVATQNRNQN